MSLAAQTVPRRKCCGDAAVMAFLQVPPDAAGSVLKRSGFFSPLPEKGEVPSPKTFVKWLDRKAGMSAGAYLTIARKEAQAASAPLAFCKGGRSNLGIAGVAPIQTEESQVRKRWSAKGFLDSVVCLPSGSSNPQGRETTHQDCWWVDFQRQQAPSHHAHGS